MIADSITVYFKIHAVSRFDLKLFRSTNLQHLQSVKVFFCDENIFKVNSLVAWKYFQKKYISRVIDDTN